MMPAILNGQKEVISGSFHVSIYKDQTMQEITNAIPAKILIAHLSLPMDLIISQHRMVNSFWNGTQIR